MTLIYITNTRLPSEKANSYQSMQMCHHFAKHFDSVELWIPKAHNTEELNQVNDIYSFYNIKKNFVIKRFFQCDLTLLKLINEFIWANLKGLVFALNIIFNLIFLKNKDRIIFTRDWYVLKILLLAKKMGLINYKIYYEAHKFSNRLLNNFKKIDGLVVINKYLHLLYEDKRIPNILIAHDGVNLEEYASIPIYKYDINKDTFNIVYTGSFFKWKGVYTLADSMRFLNNNVNLILIGGTGEYLEDLKTYIKKQNLKNITIIPHMPKKETIKYIKGADVLLLPNSAKDKMSLYTSPIKLFEYMASFRPIIASNLSSICEVLEDKKNAILFEPDNPKDLADKINNVLNTDCHKLVHQAYEDVAEYSWNNRAVNIKNFINNNK